jgi:mannonate dehydratase
VNRRQFVSSSAVVAAMGGGLPVRVKGAPAKPVLMKLGCQTAPSNDKHFGYLARYGVRNVCGYPEIADGRLYATVDETKGEVL